MGTLIDSSVLIARERGRLDFEGAIERHGDEEVAIASITASELLHGVRRATTVDQRNRRSTYVERLLADLPVLAFDLAVARVHAEIWADLSARGLHPGAHDLLIAATAARYGYGVATRNPAHFRMVPGLEVHEW
jgi:tRNA(fMet)-specific endonuclease VapC